MQDNRTNILALDYSIFTGNGQGVDPHGGNIYRLIEGKIFSIDEVIDFSASINPLGVPEIVSEKIRENIKHLCHYPDPDSKHLTLEIARHYDINPHSIICGNGSTELIYLVVRALKPKKVLIPEPTFSEYERACKLSGCLQVEYFKLEKKDDFDLNIDNFILSLTASNSSMPFDMAFLCNPNNPTGRVIRKDDVLKIADAAKKLKCYLIIDEAFIDFTPAESVVQEVQRNPYLIVLRSMTKFYGLSGLRIGYGIFPKAIEGLIKKYKEPWTVNTLAQLAGITALNDIEYKERTFSLIKEEKDFLEKEFERLGIDYISSDVNFYLLRLNNAKKIILALRDKGILVRDCSNFRGLDSSYIRVAVKSNRDNMKLVKELNNL